ncbi:MAG: acyl-CoA thioesterase [Campylobacterales bacterium]|nr:acyl-CoA thioesterase [Campylobacterales bacterium]
MIIYKKRIKVSEKDIDANGHVNNIRYLEWFLDAATEHSEKIGAGLKLLREMNRTWVAKEHHINYKLSSLIDDNLELETWLESTKSAQVTRKYKLVNITTKNLICEGETTWVFVELETFKPKRIPDKFMSLYKTL